MFHIMEDIQKASIVNTKYLCFSFFFFKNINLPDFMGLNWKDKLTVLFCTRKNTFLLRTRPPTVDPAGGGKHRLYLSSICLCSVMHKPFTPHWAAYVINIDYSNAVNAVSPPTRPYGSQRNRLFTCRIVGDDWRPEWNECVFPEGFKQHFNMQIDLWVSAQWDNENQPCVLI